MRRKRKKQPLTDVEMATLSIKPHWWFDEQESVEITGYKLPFGIQAEATYKGIKYSGILYPEEIVNDRGPHTTTDTTSSGMGID